MPVSLISLDATIFYFYSYLVIPLLEKERCIPPPQRMGIVFFIDTAVVY